MAKDCHCIAQPKVVYFLLFTEACFSRQGVIEARMESFKSSHAFGLSLVEQGHFAAEEIQENCEEMTLVKDELMETWREKQVELTQSYELQVCYNSIRSSGPVIG